MGLCVGFKTGSSPGSGYMVALDFLTQKVALIVASTHWVWVSIQGVNALTGLGVVLPRCVLSVRE